MFAPCCRVFSAPINARNPADDTQECRAGIRVDGSVWLCTVGADSSGLHRENDCREQASTEDYTIAITVDLRAKTVTVGSYGTVPIVSDTDSDTVVFMVDKNSIAQVSTGTLNRITGEASVHIITLTDGLYLFYGTCKAAQKLF